MSEPTIPDPGDHGPDQEQQQGQGLRSWPATWAMYRPQQLRLRRRVRRGRGRALGSLSMLDPVDLGLDEDGQRVTITLAYRNLLVGGEPGAGKSVLLSNVIAHAALAVDARLVLLDGKLVELGMWAPVADIFVGPDPGHAIDVLRHLQDEMDAGYRRLFAEGRRKIDHSDVVVVNGRARALFTVCVVDEIAYYSATAGDKKTQEAFSGLLRDLVARGRAVGVIVIAATQRPSSDIIPTSLRDLFGFRCAFRCTTDSSSDIILGSGWAKQGFTAMDIPAEDIGIGWLLAEGGKPRRFKACFLTDAHVDAFTAHAARTQDEGDPW